MKNIYLILFILFSLSCSQQSEIQVMENEPEGKNMVLIGNSFFRPYAQKFDLMALDLQIQNHQSTLIFRGGDNGRPINFWNDSNAPEHQAIKEALDTGEINLFGMTAGHEPENPTEGHRAWIDYAVQRNPNRLYSSLSLLLIFQQIGINKLKSMDSKPCKNYTITL